MAGWLTDLVHGSEGVETAKRATEIFFGGEVSGLNERQLGEIFADVPSSELPADELSGEGLWIVEALTKSGLTSSNGEARRTIKEGGAYVNNRRITDQDTRLSSSDLASDTIMVLRRGKKKYALLRFV